MDRMVFDGGAADLHILADNDDPMQLRLLVLTGFRPRLSHRLYIYWSRPKPGPTLVLDPDPIELPSVSDTSSNTYQRRSTLSGFRNGEESEWQPGPTIVLGPGDVFKILYKREGNEEKQERETKRHRKQNFPNLLRSSKEKFSPRSSKEKFSPQIQRRNSLRKFSTNSNLPLPIAMDLNPSSVTHKFDGTSESVSSLSSEPTDDQPLEATYDHALDKLLRKFELQPTPSEITYKKNIAYTKLNFSEIEQLAQVAAQLASSATEIGYSASKLTEFAVQTSSKLAEFCLQTSGEALARISFSADRLFELAIDLVKASSLLASLAGDPVSGNSVGPTHDLLLDSAPALQTPFNISITPSHIESSQKLLVKNELAHSEKLLEAVAGLAESASQFADTSVRFADVAFQLSLSAQFSEFSRLTLSSARMSVQAVKMLKETVRLFELMIYKRDLSRFGGFITF